METNNMWFTEAAFVDFEKMEVRFSDGKSESFPGVNVYKLLLYFAENKTKTLFSAKELIQCIWGDGDAAHGYSNTNLNTEIKKLRRLLRCEDRKCEDGLLFYDAGIKMYRFHPSDKQSEPPYSLEKSEISLDNELQEMKSSQQVASPSKQSENQRRTSTGKYSMWFTEDAFVDFDRMVVQFTDGSFRSISRSNVYGLLIYLAENRAKMLFSADELIQGVLGNIDVKVGYSIIRNVIKKCRELLLNDGIGEFLCFDRDKMAYRFNLPQKQSELSEDADLQDADLRGVNLRGADLQEADLQEVDLQDADLRGANLQGAYLEDADLQGADLRDVDLREANLQGADLRDADLQGANMQRAYLEDADLRWADLQEADLEGAYLENVDLEGAYLGESNLKGAYLHGVNLEGAYLGEVHLEEADLRDANLEGVDLEGAYYCTEPNIATVFPDGFNPKEHGMIEVDEHGKPVE